MSAHDDLLQRVLDGEADPAEARRLAAALAADPALRERHEELREAFAALATARLDEPPADLKASVMREVRALAAPRPARAAGAAPWRWMLPAAAGLAAGLLLWIGFGGALAPRDDRLAGTIGAPAGALHDRTLAAPTGTVRVTVWRADGDAFRVRLLASGGAAVAWLESPDGSLAIEGPPPATDDGVAGWRLEPGRAMEVRVHGSADSHDPVLRAVVRSWTPPQEILIRLRGSE